MYQGQSGKMGGEKLKKAGTLFMITKTKIKKRIRKRRVVGMRYNYLRLVKGITSRIKRIVCIQNVCPQHTYRTFRCSKCLVY